MSFFQKVTLNTLASVAGKVLGGALAVVSVGFMTRALGKEGFGDYTTIVAYVATLEVLADLGLYSLLTREIAQRPHEEKKIVSYFFTLRLLAALFVLGGGAALIFLFPYSMGVKVGVAYAAVGFLFLSLTQLVMGIFQKYLQIYKVALFEVIGRSVQVSLVAFFFTQGGGLLHYVTALVVAAFVIGTLNLGFAWRLVRFRFAFSVREAKHIIPPALPIAASLVFTMLYFRMDTLLLYHLAGREDAGIYGAAYRVLEVLIFFPAAFIGLVFPKLSQYAKENKERMGRLASLLWDTMTVIALPLVVGGSILAASIVFIIGGEDFLASALPLQVLFVAIGIIFYGTLLGHTVVALNEQKKAMWAYLLGFLFNLGANIIIIPRFASVGAAATTVLTELLVTAYLAWIVMRALEVRPSFGILIKTTLATVAMGGAVWFFAQPIGEPLAPLRLIGAVALGAAVYGALMGLPIKRLFKEGSRISSKTNGSI